MNKIFTVILSDEFSTSEVIKLFAGEFDNLEVYLQTYQLTSNKNLSLF